jgi:acyl-homoserine lactone synthase
MQFLVIDGKDCSRHAQLMDEIFVLRHKVFVEENGWDTLARPDGRERDQFDNEHALHLLMMEGSQIAVYSRLLPTEQPHLLSDVYPHLATRGIPRGPDIYEWTRMCVSKPWRGDGRWSFGAGEMVRAVVEFCLETGITATTWEGHPVWLSRFTELGFDVRPLGLPVRYDHGPVLPAIMDMNHTVLEALIDRGIPHVGRASSIAA